MASKGFVNCPSGPEGPIDSAGFLRGLKPPPPSGPDFSAHLLLLLLVVFASLPMFSQQASGYRIAGTVVSASTGEPVWGATVAALAEEGGRTVAAVASGNDGRFALEGLPAAKYQLAASKRGFVSAFYDQHEEFSSAIVPGPGQDTGSLTFRLVPSAVLRGVVTADGGDPVAGATVMLFQKPQGHNPGEKIAQVDSATTDDTGSYEFGNLAAGEYLLAVKAEPWYALHRPAAVSHPAPDPAAALDVAYPVTYFDSTTDEASAMPIVLAGGSREEANVSLHAVPALHLVVETPRKQDGSIARPELKQTVFGSVVAAESAGFMDAIQRGTTEFSGVPPGHYELAQGDPPRIVALDAAASQQVDPNAGVPASAVTGILRSASGAALTGEAIVILEPLDGAQGQRTMQASCNRGAFSFPAVTAGTWELRAENSGELPIVSMTVGGRMHTGSQIAVRDRPLSLVATVSESAVRVEGFARKAVAGVETGLAGAMVVLVPQNMADFRGLVRRDQSDSDGSFSLRDVASGSYTVVAIEDGWALDWSRSEVIGRYLPKGIAVTVTDRSGKVVRLSQPVPVQPR